jgi:hypothetical protein
LSKNVFEGKNFFIKFQSQTNFFLACEKGLKDEVGYYISEINSVNKDGQTPLLIGKYLKIY